MPEVETKGGMTKHFSYDEAGAKKAKAFAKKTGGKMKSKKGKK